MLDVGGITWPKKAKLLFVSLIPLELFDNFFKNDFYFNIRGELSVFRCYTLFFSMAENRF